MSAVEDTAGEITIIAHWVYYQMPPNPAIYSNIDVNLCRGGAIMAVGALGGVLIEIGESQLNYLVYVVLFQDDIFLSNDFMQKK